MQPSQCLKACIFLITWIFPVTFSIIFNMTLQVTETSVIYSPHYMSNMYTHACFLGGMSCTFNPGSLSCKINKGHIRDQLPHSPFEL